MPDKEPRFFACTKCGVLIEEIAGNKTHYSCGGKELEELTPNTSEGAQEKHLPVVERQWGHGHRQGGQRLSPHVRRAQHPMGLSADGKRLPAGRSVL